MAQEYSLLPPRTMLGSMAEGGARNLRLTKIFNPGNPMEFKAQKDQELLVLLDNIEKSYNPSSPSYKFRYVFYNKVDAPFSRPFDFPEGLWNISLASNQTMMPVLLKGDEIESRKVLQTDVCQKINDSYDFLRKRISSMRMRSERLKTKIENCAQSYRRVFGNVYSKCRKDEERCVLLDHIYRVNATLDKREKLCVVESRNEVMDALVDLKMQGEDILHKTEDALQERQKQTVIQNELDRV